MDERRQPLLATHEHEEVVAVDVDEGDEELDLPASAAKAAVRRAAVGGVCASIFFAVLSFSLSVCV